MPPTQLIDISQLNWEHPIIDAAQIERVNPQRFEMRHLDGIVHLDEQAGTVAGFKNVTESEFWVRGHIPGRPLMPGVLMLEAAAQLVSYAVKQLRQGEGFFGFSGIENVKFRGTVVPPSRLDMIGKLVENRPRRFICDTQGFVAGQMVFEARIIGMPI